MRRIEEENLYAILGVSSSATQAEIQAAYKKKARELHPDVNRSEDAEDQFKRLGEAYAVLRDERKRARYDAFGAGRSQTGRRGRSSSRTGARTRAWAHADVGYDDVRTGTDDLGNPFEDLLRRAQSRRTRPQEEKVTITLAEAYTGSTVDVRISAGAKRGQKIRVKVPPGARTGDRLRLPDHMLTVILKVDLGAYKLEGRDVRMTVKVAPWEAALGEDISIRAPHAKLRLRIPPGTESHQMLRIKGQGLPVKPGRPGQPGDLFVRVVIATPPSLTARERELYQELAAVSAWRPRSQD